MKNKKKVYITINKENYRDMLERLTGFAVTRFQKAVSSDLLGITDNLKKADKQDIQKSFLSLLGSLEELGSDIQDILPLIEDVEDLTENKEEKD